MNLKSVIEKDIEEEVRRARMSPEDLEGHIRSAFMNGMVLGARLQAKMNTAEASADGWCALPEE